MKNLKYIFSFLLLAFFISCENDDNGTDISGIEAPKNISAIFTITQDNSGLVTIRPNGEGVSYYEIHFGDGTQEPASVRAGETANHTYAEGIYTVKIVATTLNGATTEFTKELTVSYLQPRNLEVTAIPGPNRTLKVTAKAELETFFQIYFGEDPNQIPVDFNEGEEITHTYANTGTYQIRVVALSGGAATLEHTETVTITNMTAAPDPMFSGANVISLFSDSYNNVTVDTWRTSWSNATLEDIDINGNATKKYSALDFVGIETVTAPINASQMTHFHTDVWSSDFTDFKIKLVDFGPDGAYGGGDDKEHEVTISNPARESWVGIDIPLSDFTGLTTRGHIAQLIYAATPSAGTTVYIDNVYFYKQAAEPIIAAPTPTLPGSQVISMFSNAYTNVPVDTWRTSWSSGTLTDIQIEGNDTKKYSNLDFVGIESTNPSINATAMTHFHTDVWSGDFTVLKIKLVDFGADGAYGGGDDKEHEITINAPEQQTWISLDIPLSNFTGLTTRAHISQLIYVANPTGNNTIYVDNVYFHN